MTVSELQQRIKALKEEKDFCILAHAYQSQEILEVADYTGDSFALSRLATKVSNKNVLLCGVKFMAETVKILNPEKRVFLSSADAGCPMADMIDKETLLQLKETYPDYAVVAYVNTTAETKTVADVCVTSSSAVKVCKAIPSDKILFVPDCNLGDWVAKQVPEKTFAFMRGGCPTHLRMSVTDVENARKAHPEAKLLVHPECHPKVTAQADYIGSTTEIMAYAEKSDAKEFIIGTENSIVEHLSYACPDKRFYPLSKDCVCHNMKLTGLTDVYRALQGDAEEIVLDEDTRLKAKASLDRMLEYGN
ncbi:MAG: quinolinate synthase NadA [Clostridia bacterium]|nr:quinolinate synthase NadA [Clostridia bacterium]